MIMKPHLKLAPVAMLLFLVFAFGSKCLLAAEASQDPSPLPSGMTLASPMPYVVFQRSASNTARIPIAGRVDGPVALVEAKATLMAPYQSGIDGRSVEYAEIAKPNAAEFAGALEVPAGGWYALT